MKAGESGPERTLTDIEMPTAEQRPASFRDKLLGRSPPDAQVEADDWILDDEEISHEEETNLDCLIVKLSEETDLDCLIVKLSKEEKDRLRGP